jgi:zinc transporter ZupT
MSSTVLLTYYCLLILLASIGGGMIPVWFRLSHRWMECAVSFVAGVMLGIGLLHMLPHALEQAEQSIPPDQAHWQVVTASRTAKSPANIITIMVTVTITITATIFPGAARHWG